MKPPCEIDGFKMIVDVSIGVALYPEHGTRLGPLIQRAYIAMYLAREKTGSIRPIQKIRNIAAG